MLNNKKRPAVGDGGPENGTDDYDYDNKARLTLQSPTTQAGARSSRLSHAAQSGSHPLSARGDDLYETPPAAIGALLSVERLPHWIWEPAAGRGAITRVLRDRGHAVIASNLVDYGGLHFVGDFLAQTKVPVGTEIVSRIRPLRSSARSSGTPSISARS